MHAVFSKWIIKEISFQVTLVRHFEYGLMREHWRYICAWQGRQLVFVSSREFNLILEDNVVITLVNDLVLANLRLTWYVFKNRRHLNTKLIVFTWLVWHEICFCLGPRILIKCKERLNDGSAIALRNLDIYGRSINNEISFT